ncbi:MAG: sugar kinase [Armatimonadota bacterium]|nr:sugar kinase [bacterium]
MKSQTDVACVGIFVADTLGKPIKNIPAWRQLEMVESIELATGGCASNTGMVLAKLGLNVATLGKVGNDIFGDFILSSLQKSNIDISGMKRDDKLNTSFSFVMVAPDGERAFFHYVGANGSYCIDDVDFSIIENSRILHIGGSFVMPALDGKPTAEILRRAHEKGVMTCLDTVWNGEIDAFATLKPSLPYLDYFLPSIDEASLMTGQESPADIAKFFMDHGVKTIGLKMGGEGCYVANAKEHVHLPAFKTNVVDTCGAGDSFIGGFLAGVVKGFDIEQCARLGNATGSICASSMGSSTGAKSWDETIEYMNNAELLEVS